MPVILATVLGAVAGPAVGRLERHRVPRIGGAILVLLGLVAAGVLILLLVFGGISANSAEISANLNQALDKIQGWLNLGVTIIAAFNGVVIGGAALILGAPLAGTIEIVTFVGAYVPFVGAWVAGAFAVLIALGTEGTEAALVMGVVALLANGALQQLIQPFVMGATLGLNPLVVLVVTIGPAPCSAWSD